MSNGINKVIIVGNLGNDPEINYMPSGSAVTNISVATSESWKDKQTGQQQERTEWHKIVFFNRLAEIAGEYLRKGSKVYIEGSLRTRKWQDQSGVDRYTTEIVASEMQMLDRKESGGQGDNQNQGGGYNQNQGGGNNQNQGGGNNQNQGGGYNQNQGGGNNQNQGGGNNQNQGGGNNQNQGRGNNQNHGGGNNQNQGRGNNQNQGRGNNQNHGGGYNQNQGGGNNQNQGNFSNTNNNNPADFEDDIPF